MFTSQIMTLLKSLLSYDLDSRVSQDSAPTNAQMLDDLNYAKDIISKNIFQYNPSIVLTLTAQSNALNPINIRDLSVVSGRVLRPLQVIINNRTLTDSKGQRGTWAVTELNNYIPTWRSDGAGVPYIAATVSNDKIVLYPAPSQAVVDTGGNYISGLYLAADMVVPTTVTSVATSATQTVGSTNGMVAGMNIYFDTAGVSRVIQTVNSPTSITLTASLTTTTAEVCSSEPDIPDEIRPAIAYLAAVITSEISASEEEQMVRLQAYDARVARAIEKIARENKNAQLDMGSLGRRPKYMLS